MNMTYLTFSGIVSFAAKVWAAKIWQIKNLAKSIWLLVSMKTVTFLFL